LRARKLLKQTLRVSLRAGFKIEEFKQKVFYSPLQQPASLSKALRIFQEYVSDAG
jgi:hypothetical protein